MSELEQARLALEQAGSDLEKAMKEFNRRRAQWQKILDNRNPRPKKKAGRPPIWRSIDGLGFVSAVQSIQLLEKCKLSTAIRKVLKDSEFAAFKKYDPRELQARYQEAWDFWGAPARAGLSPIGFARHKDDIALTALKDARAATLNALERHKKALERHKAALTDPTFRNRIRVFVTPLRTFRNTK